MTALLSQLIRHTTSIMNLLEFTICFYFLLVCGLPIGMAISLPTFSLSLWKKSEEPPAHFLNWDYLNIPISAEERRLIESEIGT
jgi:hypothetical protein